MKNLKICITTLIIASMVSFAEAQERVQGFVHHSSRSSDYQWPSDSLLLDKLDEWRDLKFGVIFHWGLYSLPGIVESWSICSEDVEWISRKKDLPYDEYKKWYFSLKDSLNPVDFDPVLWAEVMEKAGMKYMIFTTKHHDGFCTYDSKYTDFSIADGPFAKDPRRDMARHVFEAFRQKDFMVGAYFSKPDWHSEWYWNPSFATPDRRHNYKKERHPQWWENYRAFTRAQLTELTENYGDLDILWLDGGWVKGEEVYLDEVLEEARKRHPGLISVDRTIRGRNENYHTPERNIPETQLDHPWESCITLSNDWGWVPDAPYKSARKVINLLSEVTAKGGSLLLGVGPTAKGAIEEEVVVRLEEVGRWLDRCGDAIYNTRTASYYHEGDIWFTADKDGKTLYAIYTLPEGKTLPKSMEWRINIPDGKMIMLNTGKRVKYSCHEGKVSVVLPDDTFAEPLAFRFTLKESVPLL